MLRSLVATALALGLPALVACEARTRPWDTADAAASVDVPRPLASGTALGAPDAPGAPDGGPADAAPTDEGPAGPDAPAEPVRVGGPWVRCYGNFRPSGEPVRDLTRLSLLCGPENGMVRLSKKPLEGSVAEGAPATSTSFPAVRGECYRVFAVAETAVVDLDVTVRSSRGAAIAADHGEDGWPVVQPDRPFCTLDDDTFTVEISARRGSGRFAAEVWRLREGQP